MRLLRLSSSMPRSTSPSSRPMTSSRARMKSEVTTEMRRFSSTASSLYTATRASITSSARRGTVFDIVTVTTEACLFATSHFTALR